jgi:two-component system sensor histidine kinase AgrC
MQTVVIFFLEILICYIVFFNICKLDFKKPEIAAIILITYAAAALIFLNVQSLDISAIAANAVSVLIMVIGAYKKNKNLPLGILMALISNIVFLLSGTISGLALNFLFSPAVWPRESVIRTWWLYITGIAIFLPMAYFISRWLGNFINRKLNIFNEKLKKKFSIYLIIGTVITLVLFLTNMFLPGVISEEISINMLNAIFLAAYFAYLIFAIYTFTTNLLNEIEIRHKEELLENLQAYTDNIENMYAEMRKFRHDHTNMLLGLHSHIEEGNLDGISKYFVKYVSPFTESAPAISLALDKLRNIKIPELKSILSLKLMYAQEAGIDVHIESEDIIENVDFDLIDLCRVTGILLDNAIEACRGVPGPVIKFAAIKTANGILLVFVNTCPNQPPMSRIFDKGFSTKGEGRGMGMFILRQTVDKYKNVSLGTSVEDGNFIQQLIVS